MARDYYGSEEYARYYKPASRAVKPEDDSEYLDLLRHGTDQQLGILRDTGTANAAAMRERGSIYAGIPEKVVNNYLTGAKFRSDSQTADLNRQRTGQEMSLADLKEARDADEFAEKQRLRPLEQQDMEAKIRKAVADGYLTEEQARKLSGENDFMTQDNRKRKFDADIEKDLASAASSRAGAAASSDYARAKDANTHYLYDPIKAAAMDPRQRENMPLLTGPGAKPGSQVPSIPLVIAPEVRKALELSRMSEEQQMKQAAPAQPAMPPPRNRKEMQDRAKAEKEAAARELQALRVQNELRKAQDEKMSPEEKMIFEGNKAAYGQAAKTASEARAHRDTINRKIGELEALIKAQGTTGRGGDLSNLIAPGSAPNDMDRLIYEIAIEQAKLVDPTTAAREGEVASAKKYSMPIRNFNGLGMTNDTALDILNKNRQSANDMVTTRESEMNRLAGKPVVEKPKEKDDLDARLEAARAKNKALKGSRQ